VRQQRILIIECDPAARLLLAGLLEAEGYLVTATHFAAPLDSIAASSSPDLLLLGIDDLSAPTLEWITALRATLPLAALVLLTTSPDGYGWARIAGADGFLTKPFDIDAVVEMVGRMLGTAVEQRHHG
jgi:DNA-binding response OmpR family regulator